MPDAREVRVNGYRCTHPSVLALASHDPSEMPIEERVRSLAREKLLCAEQVLRDIDDSWAPPPFDPFLVAQAMGIRCVETDSAELGDAMLLLQEGTPTVIYRKGRARTRTSFSIFHEIAHTLFPGYENAILQRTWKKPAPFEPDGQLEHLCDIAAGEFLMPEHLFRKDLEECGFGARPVQRLGKRYGASTEAVCIRMVECDIRPCAVALLEYRRRKPKSLGRAFMDGVESEQGRPPLKNMRVVYSVQSRSYRQLNLSIPRYLSVAHSSCIHIAAWQDRLTDGEEHVSLGRSSHLFHIEALPVPSRRRRLPYSPVCVFLYPMRCP